MGATRCPPRPIITGHSATFAFLILCAMGVLVGGDTETTTGSAFSATGSATPFVENSTLTEKSTALPSKEHLALATTRAATSDTSSTKPQSLSADTPKDQPSVSSHVHTPSAKKTSPLLLATAHAASPATDVTTASNSSDIPATADQKESAAQNDTHVEADAAKTVSKTTTVMPKAQATTPSETPPSATAPFKKGASVEKPRKTTEQKETQTTPQHLASYGTPGPDSSTSGPHHSTSTTQTTSKTTGSENAEPPGSAKGTPTGVVIAIALGVLLLLALLVAGLYCRHRRHSGSTSFGEAGWAGQVALPDDSGLDKDLEQGALAAGEGEARRTTLTTFFGKRPSRVPSLTMEEIGGKESEEREASQQLIGGEAGPEGSGEANGKVPEPTMQHSQKETPLTKVG